MCKLFKFINNKIADKNSLNKKIYFLLSVILRLGML